MDAVPQLETCRICANSFLANVEFVQLFQPHESIQRELDFILKEINCWQLHINPNDGLPQQICDNCFQKFCAIKTFRNECATAQELLQKSRQITTKVPQTQISKVMLIKPEQLTAEFEQKDLGNIIVEEHAVTPKLYKNENGAINLAESVQNCTTNGTMSLEDSLSKSVVCKEADTTSQSGSENSASSRNSLADLDEVLESTFIPNILSPKEKMEKASTTLDSDDVTKEGVPQRLANAPYACNYCFCPAKGSIEHLIFQTSDELSQHFFDVHDPKLPYPCPMCPQLFEAMSARNAHVKTHQNMVKKSNKCKYCNKNLLTTQEAHEKRCDFVSNWYCHDCKKEFIKMPLHSFRAHQRAHESQFYCDICNRGFLNRSFLIVHKRSHLKTPEITDKQHDFKCIVCNESFTNAYELKRHEFTSHNTKNLFRCKLCDKGYSILSFLRRHMTNVHKINALKVGEITKNCEEIETFQQQMKLKAHESNIPSIKTTQNKRQRYFICMQCPKRFGSIEQLNVHRESHDARLRPFACNKCDVRCRTEVDLLQHNNIAHIKLSPFKCNACDKPFAFVKDLEIHKLFHAKLKIPCTYKGCNVICRNEQAYKKHSRTHESITCEYCGKLFPASEMEKHCMTTHNNNNNNLEDVNNQNSYPKTITNSLSIDNGNYAHDDDDVDVDVGVDDLIDHKFSIPNALYCTTPTLQTNLFTDSITLEDHELLTQDNDIIANNVDFNGLTDGPPLGVNDSFICSLLDPDSEIIVN